MFSTHQRDILERLMEFFVFENGAWHMATEEEGDLIFIGGEFTEVIDELEQALQDGAVPEDDLMDDVDF